MADDLRRKALALQREIDGLSSRLAAVTHDAPFAVAALEGRGLGVVALRDLRAGARLLAETPLVVVPLGAAGRDSRAEGRESMGATAAQLRAAVAAMPSDKRELFFSLSQSESFGTVKTAEGIAQTNGIPFRVAGELFGAVYLMASRFNHACDANAAFKFNTRLGQLTVHAVRPIPSGAEVTFNYAGFVACRQQRQQRLRDAFGFDCACAKCLLSGLPLHQSEQRLAMLGDATAFTSWLRSHGALWALLRSEPGAILAELEARYALLELECSGFVLPGTTDIMLRHFCDFCSSAASRLAKLHADGLADPAALPKGVLLESLARRAAAYAEGSRTWAVKAREVALLMAGQDSQVYASYAQES